ncbi:oligoribonuclease [Paenibacillus sp.]|uniref:DHH family phosphoesterase n=1 Tax=Paenibacillus sp. TaxID=58172 RepID=UPI0028117BAF|nr:oligoribonuclease [Paenibacillus sp.]
MHHLYTHNDLDGVGCGVVARCAFGDKIEIRYNSVQSINPQVSRYMDAYREKPKKGGFLFVTDLSVSEEVEARIDRFLQNGGKARLLDHHKTSLHLNRHPWATVQVEYDDGRQTSATSLFYDYLVQHRMLQPNEALAAFVELVRQYDTWEWETHDNVMAKRLNDLFFLLSLDEFEDRMVERVQRKEAFAFTDFEEKLLELEESKIDRYVRRKKRELVQTFVSDRCVGIVHAESYHSELSHELGKAFPHLDYIAILNVGGKKLSLRTVHDHVDVSDIAAGYGGGGHAKAAGCPLSDAAFRAYAVEPFALDPPRPDADRNEYNVKGSEYGALYENRAGEQLFLFQAEGRWHLDANGETAEPAFDAFEEAERYVKRRYAAWLVRDDAFIQYLMGHASKR